MGIANLFNLMMANFRSRYDLNSSLENFYPTRNSGTSTSGINTGIFQPVAQEPTKIPEPVDTYIPSPQNTDVPQQQITKPDPEASSVGAEKPVRPEIEGEPEDQVQTLPESKPATYSFERKAQLDYRMDLRFELAAFTRAVENLAEGDSDEARRLAAAGFGFSANLAFNGSQTVRTSGDDNAPAPTAQQRSLDGSSQAASFSKHSENFALEGFYKEAASVRRSSKVINSAAHRMTVNKFASRFQMDSRFSFSFLERFNEQTEQTAVNNPNEVNRYIQSAGDIAETGTPELMAAFFDGVDGFLNGAEEALTARATAMFNEAAAELGFEGEMVDFARDQFVGTIDRFFDRVESAITAIRSQFEVPEPNALINEPIVPEVETNPDRNPSAADYSSNLAV